MQQEWTKSRRKTEITETKLINKKLKRREQRSKMSNKNKRARGKVARHWNSLSMVMSDMLHDTFYATVPDDYKNRTYYYQEYILSSPSMNGTFLPFVMGNMTGLEDYVFFKLDIDSGEIERGTVDFILSSSDDIQHVTEFVWEHHVAGNYIMAPSWGVSVENATIYESYNLFLWMRQRGIRAHSYV
jgi:hypothetical protein